MPREIELLREDVLRAIRVGVSATLLRAQLLGRFGLVTQAFYKLRELPRDERARYGEELNELKDLAEKHVARLVEKAPRPTFKLPPLPAGGVRGDGVPNVLQETVARLSAFFSSQGFVRISGPHIDTPEVNFDFLNTPANHPSRKSTDTFYLDSKAMLRTHTTGTLASRVGHLRPPFKAYTLGPVYRNDDEDATHTTMFHQIDVLILGWEQLSLAHLRGLVDDVLCAVSGRAVDWEFVPSYFPFTMPGGEAYVDGVEVLGCGLLHQNVLGAMGRPDCRGLALGMGIERICALNQQRAINIRELYQAEVRRYC